MYEMKEEYRTGINEVDIEHEALFAIADKLYYIVKDDFIPDKFDYIIEIINELRDYADYHFKNEEAYMESIQFKQIFSQKIAHKEFMNKIDSYDMETVDSNQQEVILELLDYLGNWLVDHILERDLLIGR